MNQTENQNEEKSTPEKVKSKNKTSAEILTTKKEGTSNLLPEMSEKFDVILKNLLFAKRDMGHLVRKDAKNPFHKSTYASLGAHLELCEGVLDRHGLIMLQTINEIFDKPILIATLCHIESGQWIKSYLPLPNQKGDSQGIGSSITYMRRYSINSMLGLTAEDDDGESTTIRESKLSNSQILNIQKLENRLNSECKKKLYDWIKNAYKVEKLEQIPSEYYLKVVIAFENAVKFIEQKQLEAHV